MSRVRPSSRVPPLAYAAALAALALLLAWALSGAGRGAVATLAPEAIAIGGAAPAARLRIDAGDTVQARVRWRVPDDPGARWVAWVRRAPLDRLRFSAGGWSGPEHDFFLPGPHEGLAGGFVTPLPALHGDAVALDLAATADAALALTPLLVRERDLPALERRAAAAASAVYAVLLASSLLALALHAATRDRAHLAFSGCAIAALAMLAAANGHLYGVVPLAALGHWGAAGLHALVLLFLAAWLQAMRCHAGTVLPPRASRWSDGARWGLLAAVALCLFDVPALGPPLAVATRAACWLAATAGAAWLALAALRRVPLALPLLALHSATAALALADAFGAGGGADPLLVRHAAQAGLAATLVTMQIGLVARIAEFRDQRDRDRQARADSERRMAREAARGDLGQALQAGLRQLEPGDIERTAFRMLFDRLLPLLPATSAVAVARGFHGGRMLVAHPPDRRDAWAREVERRELSLKRAFAAGLPRQQLQGDDGRAGMEAMIPLRIHAPGWGGVVLRREGIDGFTAEELAMAGEFVRLAESHVEQAVTAARLRRTAERDGLTGALNRRSIDKCLERCFADAVRDGHPLSVVFVDLDRFKAINDRHGHAVGDRCLRDVAAALWTVLGEEALFGRYGGEEFIAILPGQDGGAARAAGERMRVAVERLDVRDGAVPVRLTVSVGLATRRDGERTPQALLERADKALYAAKRGGRNCVHAAPAVFS